MCRMRVRRRQKAERKVRPTHGDLPRRKRGSRRSERGGLVQRDEVRQLLLRSVRLLASRLVLHERHHVHLDLLLVWLMKPPARPPPPRHARRLPHPLLIVPAQRSVRLDRGRDVSDESETSREWRRKTRRSAGPATAAVAV